MLTLPTPVRGLVRGAGPAQSSRPPGSALLTPHSPRSSWRERVGIEPTEVASGASQRF